ncbi:MAG: hypothetical protein AB7O97_17260 [Planctomycetota bacterium]
MVAQDECATATALVAGANGPFDLSLLTLSTPSFTCASVNSADGWYSFATPAIGGQLTIDTFGSAIDTVLEVWDGCGGAVVACNDDTGGLQSQVSFATAPGATYIARVGRFGSTVAGLFSINVTFSSPDECAGALPIVDGLNGPFNTTGATTSAPATTCASINSDIWLVHTASCDGVLTVNTESAGTTPLSDTVMEAWDSCGGTVLACDDDGGPGAYSQFSIPVLAGTQYFFRVGDFGTTTISQGVFNIRVVNAPTPGGFNDECACAIPLALGANAVDTTGSTLSSPSVSCAFVSGGDLWYTYTVAGSGCQEVRFDTFGSGVDTVIEVWDACGGTVIDCNDDTGGFPPGESEVVIPVASGGDSFVVRVARFGSATGPFTVNVTETPVVLANDDCAGALPVTLGDNGPFDTACSTTSTPAGTCGLLGRDLWYSFTAGCDAPHTFSTCDSDYDTVIELWDACGGTVLGCNDDSTLICTASIRQSLLTAPLVNGSTYLVRVGGFNGAVGVHNLRITTGTSTGSIVNPSTVSSCPSPATLTVTGSSNIGESLTADLIGATGLGMVGYGFAPNVPIPAPCGCDIIGDGAGNLGFFAFTSSYALTIPCFPSFIGVSFDMQGLDLFPTSGGCSFAGIPFGATDIATITIG